MNAGEIEPVSVTVVLSIPRVDRVLRRGSVQPRSEKEVHVEITRLGISLPDMLDRRMG